MKQRGSLRYLGLVLMVGCGAGGAPSFGMPPVETSSHYAASAEPSGGYGGEVAVTTVSPSPLPSASTGTTTTTTTTSVEVTTVTESTIDAPVVEYQQHPWPMLTAASVGDVDRRDNYLGFLARHPWADQEIQLDMTRRVRVRVIDAYGRPVNDARVVVRGAQHARLAAIGRTHADGVWDFHPGVSTPGAFGQAVIEVTAAQEQARAVVDVPAAGDGAEVVVRLSARAAGAPQLLDLGFLIDVTGSMEDELRYVNAEIGRIVQEIEAAAPETVVRVGATFYRDRSDREVVQQIGFTTDVPGFAAAMRGVRASGGGDYPEDMNAGLEAAMAMDWTLGNAARVLVVIADAPPKRYADAQYTYHHALLDAQERGVRIVPVAASGADRKVEYLFRALGAFTSTPYVYLTDDSGIGNPHLEADTDRVAVEYFADLLTRMVISDLRGEGMHEPGTFGPVQ